MTLGAQNHLHVMTLISQLRTGLGYCLLLFTVIINTGNNATFVHVSKPDSQLQFACLPYFFENFYFVLCCVKSNLLPDSVRVASENIIILSCYFGSH